MCVCVKWTICISMSSLDRESYREDLLPDEDFLALLLEAVAGLLPLITLDLCLMDPFFLRLVCNTNTQHNKHAELQSSTIHVKIFLWTRLPVNIKQLWLRIDNFCLLSGQLTMHMGIKLQIWNSITAESQFGAELVTKYAKLISQTCWVNHKGQIFSQTIYLVL